jgi:hypothetical protein
LTSLILNRPRPKLYTNTALSVEEGAAIISDDSMASLQDGSSVPSLQSLALSVVAAHVEYESSLDYCLPIGGSLELLDTMHRQGRLRGDTLRPLLHASPDELAPVLGSRLALAAAGCPALRDVAVQRLSCPPRNCSSADEGLTATELTHGYRTGSRAVARMLDEGPVAGKPDKQPVECASNAARGAVRIVQDTRTPSVLFVD